MDTRDLKLMALLVCVIILTTFPVIRGNAEANEFCESQGYTDGSWDIGKYKCYNVVEYTTGKNKFKIIQDEKIFRIK